jgi:hypothetical protein
MAELALWADDNGDATDYTYGSDPNNALTWDYDRVHGCLCDAGFSGYDCSEKLCPTGDDPGTYDDHSELQLLQCIADEGNFTLSFRQQETVVLSYNITASELQAALSALPTIRDVLVYFSQDGPPPNGTLNYIQPTKIVPQSPDVVYYNETGVFDSVMCSSDGSQVVMVHFVSTPGSLPALRVNNTFLLDTVNFAGGLESGLINVFTDGMAVEGLTSIKGSTENDVCNHRGLCDTSTGYCACFEDWSSSDGKRQGGPGHTADCGYRNDHKFTYFQSQSQQQ